MKKTYEIPELNLRDLTNSVICVRGEVEVDEGIL